MGGGVLSKLFSKVLASAGDDVASKVASQYSDDAIRTLARSSADDIAATQGNLIATHQLTPHKLAQVADLDGFVQPSMAVVDPSKGTNFLPGSDFGDIVMVANRNTVKPTRGAGGTIIGDRDIYSPRFPDVSYEVNMPAIDDIAKQTGSSRQYTLSNIDIATDDPVYNNLLQEMYKKTTPGAADIDRFALRDMPEFKQFADDTMAKVRGDKILEYRTPSGSVKSLPHNAENANKIMNKRGAVGTESGWQSPSVNAYHQNTNMLKSLDDLYKNKYRLIDNNTGELTKEAMTDELARISAKVDALDLPMLRNDNRYMQTDDTANFVADLASGNKARHDTSSLPDDILQEIEQLRQAYQKAPVSYFEAKPRRVVRGDEFHAAFIPDDSSPEVMAHLERLGVKNIQKYLDKGDLDLSLAKLAKEGKRGTSPYVLGLGGALPTAGILGSMFSGGSNQEQA